MTSEADAFRAATRLIEQHGAGAALVAAEHVRQRQEQGDLSALRHWTLILEMIEKIGSLPDAESERG